MSEEVTLDEFIGDDERVLSAEPQGVRLALDESYPEEWGFAELEEVCEVNSGFTWNKEQETDSSENGSVPVIKIGNVQDGYLNLDDILYLTGVTDEDLRENKARRNWLLMIGSNGSGERVGHCGIIEEDMEFVYASFLYGLHADSDYLLPRFLFYSLNRSKVQQRLTSFTAGSTSLKNLNKSTIENLSIPTPPLPEQSKIATVLYTVDRAIEKTEEVISQIESVLSGVTEELLIEGYGEKELQQNRIYSFEFQTPTDWEVVELQSLNKDSKPICYGIVQPGNYQKGGIPILNIEHSRYGDDIDTDELHRVSTQLHEKYARSKLTGGEIVISVKGSTGDVGKVPSNIDEWNISRDLARISPDDGINRDWLRFYLSTELAQKFIHVNSPGSTRDSLNIGDLKQLPILLPPQDEQDKIADVVADIEHKLDSENQYLNQLKRLKCGLMQDLLSGKVRTTDTNIEVPEEIKQHG